MLVYAVMQTRSCRSSRIKENTFTLLNISDIMSSQQMRIVMKMQRTTNQRKQNTPYVQDEENTKPTLHGLRNIQTKYLINLLYNIKQLRSRSMKARTSSSQTVTPTI
jgi:hypothetical protein